ncbi:hypothetical protein DY000_02061570 [Brassica cretica]|uniref:Uncharacterized protein n=1 Tax=Brassica cretica TaxID=69181 RepID=A0ABQ7B362_BRACR|nr:hypothetical protein DY000_02061570 [Brassica cretica]
MMFLSSRRSRRHQPHRNRSSDEAVRAPSSFDVHERVVHARGPPEIVSAGAPLPATTIIRRCRPPLSFAVAAGEHSGKPLPPSAVTAGDSLVTR